MIKGELHLSKVYNERGKVPQQHKVQHMCGSLPHSIIYTKCKNEQVKIMDKMDNHRHYGITMTGLDKTK